MGLLCGLGIAGVCASPTQLQETQGCTILAEGSTVRLLVGKCQVFGALRERKCLALQEKSTRLVSLCKRKGAEPGC